LGEPEACATGSADNRQQYCPWTSATSAWHEPGRTLIEHKRADNITLSRMLNILCFDPVFNGGGVCFCEAFESLKRVKERTEINV